MSKSTKFDQLLSRLAEAEVDFILIGGLAGIAHGSNRATLDVDVVYRRNDINIDRLVLALGPSNPYLRGAPPGLPFVWDSITLKEGLNFTLSTDIGDIDLLGEVAGGGTFESLEGHTKQIQIFGTEMKCVNLAKLIELKRAAGRPKDMEAIAELEFLLSQQ